MSDTNPFDAHPPAEVTGRWARVGATAEEVAQLPDDDDVAGQSDGDLAERLAALRAGPVEFDGDTPESVSTGLDADSTTDTAKLSDDGVTAVAVDVSQVTPDSE